jgi:hypothetical protein
MSLLRPLPAEFEPAIDARQRRTHSPEVELLQKSGILKVTDGLEAHTVETMGQVGLGLSSVLTRLAMIMEGGETDAVKLGAIKIALGLHMHPAFVAKKTSEEKTQPTIIFNVSSPAGAQTQVNMLNVLAPAGQKLESW